MDPSRDGPPTDIDTPIREDAGDALGCRTYLEVVPNSEQGDVAREAMTWDQAGVLAGGMPTTASARGHDPTMLVAAIAGEFG